MKSSEILLLGATGLVGGEVARLLVQGGVPVAAMVRDPSRAGELEELGVELRRGDWNDGMSLDAPLRGIRRLLLCTGADTRQLVQQGKLIDAARRGDVDFIVKVSMLGAATQSMFRQARWHAQIEHQLLAARILHVNLQAHYFMQNLLAQASVIADSDQFYGACGAGRISLVDARDVAAVAAQMLAEPPAESADRPLTGPTALAMSELADSLSRKLGRSIRYADQKAAVFAQSLVAANVESWLAEEVSMMHAFFSGDGAAQISTAVEAILGRPPRAFDDFVQDHQARFAISANRACT